MNVKQILAELDRDIARLTEARTVLIGADVAKRRVGRPRKAVVVAEPVARKVVKKQRNASPESRKPMTQAVKKNGAAKKRAAK